MNAGSADRSAAWLNEFLENIAVEADLAGSLAGRLNRSDPLSQIPRPLHRTPAKAVQHLGYARCPNRSTLKSQLIMAYIPIRGPLAKTHPQLRQDAVRLLALAGSH